MEWVRESEREVDLGEMVKWFVPFCGERLEELLPGSQRGTFYLL